MNWIYKEQEITSVDQLPDNAYGFIYCITYDDGTAYIGKKNLYTYSVLPMLKNGKLRNENSIIIHKNIDRKRTPLEQLIKESNWKKYNSSSKLVTDKVPVKKEIIDIAISKRQLTYLEVKHQFILEVLENELFLNDNISGRFFKGNIT